MQLAEALASRKKKQPAGVNELKFGALLHSDAMAKSLRGAKEEA
jgi:hypothetical protein